MLFYINVILKQNKFTFTVPSDKSNLVSFVSSIIKNIVVSASPCRAGFPVKFVVLL